MNYYHKSIILVFALTVLISCTPAARVDDSGTAVRVEIRKEGNGFRLYRGGEPFFIKGAVGWSYLEYLAEAGANSLRTGPRLLDEAHSLGLTVLVNLRMGAERDGFDYNDGEAVQEQFNRIREIVMEHRDHPAVLMWAVGNELDHIPGNLDYNLKMWDAVNDIARMIKEADPNHPVMTVIGTGRPEKLGDLIERCPDLDLLGINAYADIVDVPAWLREFNWNKPYAVTEWGPSGHWEVPRTRWGVVIEETSTEKALLYRERYERVMLSDPWCIGSYAFLWTSDRQERTHTWYNMFTGDGLKKGSIGSMQYMWTGRWPENRAPEIESLTINGMSARDNVSLVPGSINTARVVVADPDNDPLTIEWELLPEPSQFGAYAGQGEKKPPAVEGFIRSAENGEIKFEVPGQPGNNYRLFVYGYDNRGNAATANIPFFVNSR
jgi:hypothetical protein